jgi:hypothetical protein
MEKKTEFLIEVVEKANRDLASKDDIAWKIE